MRSPITPHSSLSFYFRERRKGMSGAQNERALLNLLEIKLTEREESIWATEWALLNLQWFGKCIMHSEMRNPPKINLSGGAIWASTIKPPSGFLLRPRGAEGDRGVRGADAWVGGGHAGGGAGHLQDEGPQEHGGALHETRRWVQFISKWSKKCYWASMPPAWLSLLGIIAFCTAALAVLLVAVGLGHRPHNY